jgi:hypothetical protein
VEIHRRQSDPTQKPRPDAGPIKRTFGGQPDSGAPTSSTVPFYAGLVTGSLLTVVLFFALYADVKPDPEVMRLPRLLRLGLVLGFFAILMLVLVGEVVLINRIGRLPKGLEKYDEISD